MRALSFRKKTKYTEEEMVPYLEDKVSKSALNRWSHDQQLTLTKDHPLIAH